jgi:hypothetical protein
MAMMLLTRCGAGLLSVLLSLFPVMAPLCEVACGDAPETLARAVEKSSHCGTDEAPQEGSPPPCPAHDHDRASIASSPRGNSAAPVHLALATWQSRAGGTLSPGAAGGIVSWDASPASHSPPGCSILRL